MGKRLQRFVMLNDRSQFKKDESMLITGHYTVCLSEDVKKLEEDMEEWKKFIKDEA